MSSYQTARSKSSRNIKGSYAGIVRVSESDFICDVELAARGTLTPADHKVFQDLYLEPDRVEELLHVVTTNKEAMEQTKFRIQFKLGKAFIDKEIYPVGLYMKPVDARQGATK